MVRLWHPELGREVDVPESAVRSLSRRGWRPAEERRRRRSAPVPDPAPAESAVVPEGDTNPTPDKEG